MRGGGIVEEKLRIRPNFRQNRQPLLHNPSVTATPCQLPEGELAEGQERLAWAIAQGSLPLACSAGSQSSITSLSSATSSTNFTSTAVPTSTGVLGSTSWAKTVPVSPVPVAFRYRPTFSRASLASW